MAGWKSEYTFISGLRQLIIIVTSFVFCIYYYI